MGKIDIRPNVGGDASFNTLRVQQASTNAVIIGDTSGNARGSRAVDIQAQHSSASNVASGQRAVAIGNNNTSSATDTVAIGTGASASVESATAIGLNTTASLNLATAVGAQANASGFTSAAFGAYASSTSDNSVAVGYSAHAYGYASTSIGGNTTASQRNSVAIGSIIGNDQANSIAIGVNGTQIFSDTNGVQFLQDTFIRTGYGSEKISNGSVLNVGTSGSISTTKEDNAAYAITPSAGRVFDFHVYAFKNYNGTPVYANTSADTSYTDVSVGNPDGFAIADTYSGSYQPSDYVQYSVYAYDGSEYSLLAVGGDITVSNVDAGISISWGAATNATSYKVLRTFNSVTTSATTGDTFFDDDGSTGWGADLTITPHPSNYRLLVDWDAVAGADGYRVVISDTGAGYSFNVATDTNSATTQLYYSGSAGGDSSTSPVDSDLYNFSTWTLGTGWSIDYINQLLDKGAAGTGSASLTSANMATPLVVGEYYVLTYTMTTTTSSTISVSVAGNTYTNQQPGTNTYVFKATSTGALTFSNNSSASRYKISAVSLKKITDGKLILGGSLAVGAGTPMTQVLSASATLDFPSISAAGNQDLTITVTGAAVGDVVAFSLPASPNAGVVFNAWVSATDTVKIRATNVTGSPIDPSSATYRVMVTKF